VEGVVPEDAEWEMLQAGSVTMELPAFRYEANSYSFLNNVAINTDFFLNYSL
jgi:hypothetical protein